MDLTKLQLLLTIILLILTLTSVIIGFVIVIREIWKSRKALPEWRKVENHKRGISYNVIGALRKDEDLQQINRRM